MPWFSHLQKGDNKKYWFSIITGVSQEKIDSSQKLKCKTILSTFSNRLSKGRNFRGQKRLRFCNFWPIPRNFMSTKFFKIGHTRNLMSIKVFKIGYIRKFMSAKFKYWPPTKDFVRKVFAEGNIPVHRMFSRFLSLNHIFKWHRFNQITTSF